MPCAMRVKSICDMLVKCPLSVFLCCFLKIYVLRTTTDKEIVEMNTQTQGVKKKSASQLQILS
jgi:hypothetical protein